MKKLKRCRTCHRYTLDSICPVCGDPAVGPHPPKFSPQDKFGRYRRMLKRSGEGYP